jgi:hypothetical protein
MPLVEDGIHRNGRFTRLAITENELALPTPDGNEGIDYFETRLQRHGYRGAIHNGGRHSFNRTSLHRSYWPLVIEGLSGGIDDATKQGVTHWDIHDAPGTTHFRPGGNGGTVAQ